MLAAASTYQQHVQWGKAPVKEAASLARWRQKQNGTRMSIADRSATEVTTNLVEYSVSELAFALKRTVEEAYGLVRLRGEISGFRGQHASGHCYFVLKDEKAAIEAVIWRSTLSAAQVQARAGARGGGQGPRHHLSRQIEISDRHRRSRAGRHRRAHGAARAAQDARSPPRACSTRIASCRCPICRASSAWSPRRPAP